MSLSIDQIQSHFRILLKAMTYPGQTCPAQVDNASPDALLMLTAECLIDHETSFAMLGDHPADRPHAVQGITGAECTHLQEADFLFVDGPSSHGLAKEANRGTLAYPDLGATLIYQLPDVPKAELDAQCLDTVRFSGPGIETTVHPPARGLDKKEYTLLRDINRHYPKGIDTLVIWGNVAIMGIPRSTRIEVN